MKILQLAIALIANLSCLILLAAHSQAGPNHVTYRCEKGQSLQVTFLIQSDIHPDGVATVIFPDGKTLTLPQVISASGARYSDGKTTFWTKGEGAFVEEHDKVTINNCVAVQKDASSASTLIASHNLQGTSWILFRWGGESAPKTPLQEIPISAEFTIDEIRGLGGCNRYNGGYQVKNGKLSITPLATTRKACLPEIMEREWEYLTALQGAKTYLINARGQLEISYQTEQGAGVMVFKTVSRKPQEGD
jgi:membrane-bound inhibitor of C-type lysozyme